MNKVNDYETLLELANKDLKQYNVQLSVLVIDDLGEYDVNVEHLDSGTIDNYAEGYYEDELSDIINEAWADAKKTALQLKAAMRVRAKEEAKKKYVLTNEMHLIGESIQEITLQAWPVIWDGNKYDQDSRDVLMTIREWGVEFEQWWMSHDEDWRDMHDYLEEIWDFTDKKCKEYLKRYVKDYIVSFHRTENIECNVLVHASSETEAVEKVKLAWSDDEAFGRKVCDHATGGENEYGVHQAYSTEDPYDIAL